VLVSLSDLKYGAILKQQCLSLGWEKSETLRQDTLKSKKMMIGNSKILRSWRKEGKFNAIFGFEGLRTIAEALN